MPQAVYSSQPGQARALFLAGAGLLALYLFGLRDLAGVTNALLLGFGGVVFAVLLDLPVSLLARRLPRPLSVILVLLVLGAAVFVAARWTLPALARQFTILATQLPRGLERLWVALRRSPMVAQVLPEHLDLSQIGSSAVSHVFPFLSGSLALLGGVGLIVAIGSFLCADPASDLEMLDAVVPVRHRERVHDMLTRSAELLRRWLRGSLASMAVVGVLTSIGLLLVHVHGWLALGALAFVGAIVPYLGEVVVGTAIVAAGLADSPRRALLGIVAYALVVVLEGGVLGPLISKASIRTPPTLLLIFQGVMASSFGVLGIVLAQPLLAVVVVAIQTGNERRRGLPAGSET
jgi:predicted PurR-regulated permease PerM